MAGDLYDAGLLTAIDRDALAAYCDAYARWVDAKGKVDGAGAILKSADGGYYQNPFLSVANKAMEQMLKIGSEFGMTPSSRTRVRAEVSAAKEQARAVPPRRQTSAAITGGDDPRRALSND
jgi:P27 family predicted phage terminase small subunit